MPSCKAKIWGHKSLLIHSLFSFFHHMKVLWVWLGTLSLVLWKRWTVFLQKGLLGSLRRAVLWMLRDHHLRRHYGKNIIMLRYQSPIDHTPARLLKTYGKTRISWVKPVWSPFIMTLLCYSQGNSFHALTDLRWHTNLSSFLSFTAQIQLILQVLMMSPPFPNVWPLHPLFHCFPFSLKKINECASFVGGGRAQVSFRMFHLWSLQHVHWRWGFLHFSGPFQIILVCVELRHI